MATRKKQTRKTAKVNAAFKRGLALWENWKSNFESDEIALAELIRYCNRYVKRFPKYKDMRGHQRLLKLHLYRIKDLWLKSKTSQVTEAVQSAEFTNQWIDWGSLHSAKMYEGWQDPEDYTYYKTKRFYAYTLDIEGRDYQFHSTQKLRDRVPIKEDSHGRTIPLEDGERSLNATEAILAASAAMNCKKSLSLFVKDLNEGPIEVRDGN